MFVIHLTFPNFRSTIPSETLAETIESDPLRITDLTKNKSCSLFFVYKYFHITVLLFFLALYHVTF